MTRDFPCVSFLGVIFLFLCDESLWDVSIGWCNLQVDFKRKQSLCHVERKITATGHIVELMNTLFKTMGGLKGLFLLCVCRHLLQWNFRAALINVVWWWNHRRVDTHTRLFALGLDYYEGNSQSAGSSAVQPVCLWSSLCVCKERAVWVIARS